MYLPTSYLSNMGISHESCDPSLSLQYWDKADTMSGLSVISFCLTWFSNNRKWALNSSAEQFVGGWEDFRDVFGNSFIARQIDAVSFELFSTNFSYQTFLEFRTNCVTLLRCLLHSSDLWFLFSSPLRRMAFIMSAVNHLGLVLCLTLFVRSGACLSTIGRKLS